MIHRRNVMLRKCPTSWTPIRGVTVQQKLEEAIQFVVKTFQRPQQQRPNLNRDVALQLCPRCLNFTPACLARCAICFSTLLSCGRYQTIASQQDSHAEVPTEEIAGAMETAASAVINDRNDDTEKVAKPEPI